jgi:hypothetical protein
MVVNNADNVTIEYNTVYNTYRGMTCGTSGSAGDVGTPQNAVYRYNLVYDTTYCGILVNYGHSATFDATAAFYSNIIIDSVMHDICVGCNGQGNYGTTTLNFYNNTIYNNTGGTPRPVSIARFAALGGSPTINFKNNIIYFAAASSAGLYALDDTRGLLTHSNNLIYRPPDVAQSAVEANGSYYTVEDVKNWEATAQKTDPLFADASGGDFRITSGSDAIDNGADLSAYFTRDYYGNPRPYGTGFDIGAHEYQGADNTPPGAPPNLRVATP